MFNINLSIHKKQIIFLLQHCIDNVYKKEIEPQQILNHFKFGGM